jgi:predicted RNA-binding protein with EMAP domain
MDKFTEKKDYNRKLITSVEDEIKNFSNDLAELKRIKINFYLSLL